MGHPSRAAVGHWAKGRSGNSPHALAADVRGVLDVRSVRAQIGASVVHHLQPQCRRGWVRRRRESGVRSHSQLGDHPSLSPPHTSFFLRLNLQSPSQNELVYSEFTSVLWFRSDSHAKGGSRGCMAAIRRGLELSTTANRVMSANFDPQGTASIRAELSGGCRDREGFSSGLESRCNFDTGPGQSRPVYTFVGVARHK